MSANKYFILSNAKKISNNLSNQEKIEDSSLNPLFSTLKVLDFKDMKKNDAVMFLESIDFPIKKIESSTTFKEQTAKIIEKIHKENDSFINDLYSTSKNINKDSFSYLLSEASMQYSKSQNNQNVRRMKM